MALQLTGTNGCVLRGLTSWMARATSSLPVPDSPCTSTGAMLRATFSTSVRTSCIAPDVPAMRASAWLTGAAGGGITGRGGRTGGLAGGDVSFSDGRLDGTIVGTVDGMRPRADATTA